MAAGLFDLSGRVALVTGGSRGLGKAMARVFAENGADVVISSRHEEELKSALQEILEGTGRKGKYFVADVSRRDDVAHLAKATLTEMGRVDILVNNAGMNAPQAVEKMDDSNWDRTLEVNLTSCMALTRALVPQMKGRKWGRVIFISSIMGLASKEERGAYSATKSALVGLTRAAALELGPFGVTVNCLSPGPFLTDMPAGVLSEDQKKVFSDRTALGRWGDPRELAGPALLLASDAGSYITGANVVVDGGTLCRTF